MNIFFVVKLTNNKTDVEKALEQVAETVLTMWGMQAESAVKRLCPVDTGLLRNSITWALAGGQTNISEYWDDEGEQHGFYSGQAPEDNNGSEARNIYVGTNVEYAPYQELGTIKMRAQPYLGPGIEQNIDYFKRILEGELKKAL